MFVETTDDIGVHMKICGNKTLGCTDFCKHHQDRHTCVFCNEFKMRCMDSCGERKCCDLAKVMKMAGKDNHIHNVAEWVRFNLLNQTFPSKPPGLVMVNEPVTNANVELDRYSSNGFLSADAQVFKPNYSKVEYIPAIMWGRSRRDFSPEERKFTHCRWPKHQTKKKHLAQTLPTPYLI